MNYNIFFSTFLLIVLASRINSSSLSNSSIDVENINSSNKGPTLMQMLQNILEDPEYLALSDYEQLKVLEVIYSLLESGFNQRKNKSKYHGKSILVN
jgi:hypothetical protein